MAPPLICAMQTISINRFMEKFIIDSDGKKRQATQLTCDTCLSLFLKRTSFIKEKNFCSRECSFKHQQNRALKNCSYCATEFNIPISKLKSKSGLYFCTRKCKDEAQRIENGFTALHPDHYNTGHTKYKNKAFRTYPHECHVCKYGEHAELLQVHHIDSNRLNADIENLIILCPICHLAITIKKAVMGVDRIWKWIG